MTVTHMSHRDTPVTVTHLSRVSHVPREAVPPTRPDPTHIKAGSHSSSGRRALSKAAAHPTTLPFPAMNEKTQR